MLDLANDLSALSDSNAQWLKKGRQMLIGGAWEDAQSGATTPVTDPSSGAQICTIARAGSADVDRAVDAARRAFNSGPWSRISPAERGRLLSRLADLIERDAVDLAQLETLDNGKPITQSLGIDLPLAIDFVRYMAGFATKIHGRTFDLSVPYAPGMAFSAKTLTEPVGVVGAIIPWNMPLLMAVWKLSPALAAGCSVVLKPASDTSLTALRIGELIMEAGFPNGTVNIITGPGGEVGDHLVQHRAIDKIAFTGSTSVGKSIARRSVDTMKRVSLELGGKSPVIVMNDADLDLTVPGIVMGIFANCGQVCSAGSRLYVQRSLHDRLVDLLAQAASSIVVGPGLAASTQMGPMVSFQQQQTVQGYIDAGLAEGAQLIAGGGMVEAEGYYVEPTIFSQTRQSMKIVREEIFGPVLTIQAFDTEEEAISLANDSDYGLASSIYSSNVACVDRIVPRIRAGTVWVNCHNIFDAALPFGGVKDSGIGREMGSEVIEMYTEVKSVCHSFRAG